MNARRAPRQSERAAFYGLILDPPRATPAVLAEARGPKALTEAERAERDARKKTTPAPRARRRGPRGRVDVPPVLERDESAP